MCIITSVVCLVSVEPVLVSFTNGPCFSRSMPSCQEQVVAVVAINSFRRDHILIQCLVQVLHTDHSISLAHFLRGCTLVLDLYQGLIVYCSIVIGAVLWGVVIYRPTNQSADSDKVRLTVPSMLGSLLSRGMIDWQGKTLLTLANCFLVLGRC